MANVRSDDPGVGIQPDVASRNPRPAGPDPSADDPSAPWTVAMVLLAVLRFTATVIGSLILSVAAAMLVIRWRDVTTSWGAAAAGLTLFAGVPLAGAALLSAVGGSKSLRFASGLIAVIYLLTVTPVNAIVGCGGSRTEDSFSVLTANILRSVSEPDGLARTIAASDADIVILQEVTEPIYQSLQTNELLAHYRYWSPLDGAVNFEPRSSVVVVISKLNAVSTERLDLGVAGAADVIFELPTDGPVGDPADRRTFTVTGVHLNAPSRPHYVEPWKDQLATLAQQETGRPGIMAGDFNATVDHRPFRHLLNQGWTDVHDQKGCGFGLTFPVNDMLPIPVMRLDHVLVTEHFEVQEVELLDETNRSDHRPVLAHIRLRD